jgi:hypothetical protein
VERFDRAAGAAEAVFLLSVATLPFLVMNISFRPRIHEVPRQRLGVDSVAHVAHSPAKS